MYASEDRIKVTLGTYEGHPQVLHNGLPMRIVLTPSKMCLGCTDITPEAFKFIMDKWESMFKLPEKEVVVQDGSHPC